MEQITTFQLRKDHWITPVGTFDYIAQAQEACRANDLIPEGNIKHEIEMAKIVDVIADLKAYSGTLGLESLDYFNVTPSIKYGCPDAATQPGDRVPVKRFHTIAYAVEGGCEGYYVHCGCILRVENSRDTPGYVDFGVAKLFNRDEAERLAVACQRWLTAADWN